MENVCGKENLRPSSGVPYSAEKFQFEDGYQPQTQMFYFYIGGRGSGEWKGKWVSFPLFFFLIHPCILQGEVLNSLYTPSFNAPFRKRTINYWVNSFSFQPHFIFYFF